MCKCILPSGHLDTFRDFEQVYKVVFLSICGTLDKLYTLMSPNYMKPTIYGHDTTVYNEHLYILYAVSAQLICLPCAKSTVFNDLQLTFANKPEDR